jgi:uncharacterized protein (DUF1800 family)
MAQPPPIMPPPMSPEAAWQPLPAEAWTADAARHLLRRAGWAARPEQVAEALTAGLPATLERLFPLTPPALPRPAIFGHVDKRLVELRALKRAAPTPQERQPYDREERDLARAAADDLAFQWLQTAALPEHSAYEKWHLFLSDVYVVGFEKIYNAGRLHRHLDLLRALGTGPAPVLTKAISRSPAMIVYLDLNSSSKRAPNENFARELFELFTLGEGNYTEDDIKQAARAFTGYRVSEEKGKDLDFRLSERDADRGDKTVFGQKGAFTGDDVIGLVYAQPAAATFLPREMARFYLTDHPVPQEFFTPLGRAWKDRGFSLRELCLQFFGSTIFYHSDYRANFIKSPVHYHLGLLQDLGLDVTPLPRTTLQPLRQMGQSLYNPPNVRGWVGGRLWINSSTLAARRQLAATLCQPLDEEKLNADERLELQAARDAGRGRFTVDEERIRAFTSLGAAGIADRLCDYFLPVKITDDYRRTVRDYLEKSHASDFELRTRRAAITILQSPEYQLC